MSKDVFLQKNPLTNLVSLKDDIRDIKLHLENVTDKNIQLLAENYVPAAKRYEKTVPEMQTMQADIDIMKKIITEHKNKSVLQTLPRYCIFSSAAFVPRA